MVRFGIKGRVKMISDNVKFSNFADFYSKRYLIRDVYSRMYTNDKIIYKYYVYSRRYLKERICDIIWEFLNACDDTELELYDTKLNRESMRYF